MCESRLNTSCKEQQQEQFDDAKGKLSHKEEFPRNEKQCASSERSNYNYSDNPDDPSGNSKDFHLEN